MTKSEIQDKQICLPSIIFQVANSRDQLWKTIRLNSFQKPWFISVSIFFSFAEPSSNVLSGYFYVSLNLTGIL